jgi:hypothetical protein
MPHIHLTNVASFHVLLGEIRDALVATGDWTIHQNMITPDEGAAAGGAQLVASNGDVLVGLRSTTTGSGANRLYMFDGIPPFSGTLDTMNGNSGIRYTDAEIVSAAQPGARHLQKWVGPFPNAHIFTNDPSTYLHVAVEIATGIWKHMMFGNIIKFGTWTGGGYYAAQTWSEAENQINNPGSNGHLFPFDNSFSSALAAQWTLHYQDGGVANWITPGSPYTLNSVSRQSARGGFRGGTGAIFKAYRESPFSGRIPLAPVLIQRVRTEDNPDTIRWVGQVPDIRMLNITNLAPGESMMIGADEYIAFPLVAKNGVGTTNFNSGTEGIAYLVKS